MLASTKRTFSIPLPLAQARCVRDLCVGEVDPDHPPRRADADAGAERVHPRARAEVEHAVARPQVGEVEVVADARERRERRVGDGREQRLRVAEPQREVAAGLEMPRRERVARDAAVHLLHPPLELAAVDERRGIRLRQLRSPSVIGVAHQRVTATASV